MVNRILRDDPSKGDMHNRQALSWKMVIECLLDCKLTLCLDLLRLSIFQLSENATRVRTRRGHSTPKVLEALRFSSVDIRANLQSSGHMLPIYLIAVSFGMPTNPMSAYLTLQLRDIGFDTFQTNLLTIPAYLLFIAQLLFWTWVSERWNQRFLVGLSSQLWALPLLLFLEYSPADIEHWIKYTITALLVGHPYVHAILVAITSRNAGTVRTRTVASALYNMLCQASSIISQNARILSFRP